MTDRNVSIRIGVTGKEEVRRAFEEVGQAGREAFDKTAAAVDSAGVATDRQTQRLQRLAQAARQAAAADEAQRKFNAFMGIGPAGAGSARESARVFEAELDRLDAIVKAKTAQIGVNFQSSLNAAFKFDGVAKSARESASVFEAELARVDEIARQKAEQIGANFQANLNAAFGIGGSGKSARESAKAFEEAARAAEDLERRTKALRAQIDPLAAAQDRLNAELAEADALLKAGTISTQEHAAAQALAQRRFEATAKAVGGASASMRLANYQIVNLGYQLNDVVVGLVSGQRPLTVMAQQGAQIAQIFAGTGMGVGGVLKELGRVIVGLISPTVALVAGLAAVGGTALLAYNSYIGAQKELQVATAGVGRAAGATVDQLNRIAETASSAGRVSVAAARDMEVAFLRTGRIGVEQFGGLIAIVKDYAATTGQDIQAATKELAEAFADPARGVDLLNAKVGGYDDRTRLLIKTLAAHNDLTAAQKVLLDSLRPSLIDAADSTHALGRAWDFVARQASNAFDAIGRAIDRGTNPTLQDRLDALLEERRDAATLGGRYVVGLEMPVFVPSRPLSAIDADIANVRRQIEEIDRRTAAAQADSLAARASALAGETARGLAPGFNELQTLREQQARLASALDDPLARQKVADLQQVEAAYDAVTRAITTWLDPAEKARRLDELSIRALQAKTPAQRAAIAEERRRLELAGQAITTGTAEAEIARAGAVARAEATHAIAEQSRALELNTRASLDVANAYLRGAAAAQEAEARRKALTEAIRNGVDVEMRMRQILADEIAQTAVQAARSAGDIAAQVAAQRRLNDAVAAGSMTVEQSRRQMQVEQALRPLLIAQSLAEGEAKATLGRVVEALRGSYARLHAEETRGAALGQIATQTIQIALLERQIELVGQKESLAAIEIAQLQAKNQLIQQGIALGSQEAQVFIANAGAIERLNQQLQLARASQQEIVALTDTTFNRFADLIAQGKADWKSWADAGRAAIFDINRELLKLALLNPLKNVLFGSNLPTLSSVGGLFGTILKGVGVGHVGGMAEQLTVVRSMPANVFRFAPRLHTGAFLSPDEVPAILQRGERVLNREETRRYNRGERPGQANIQVTIQTPNPSAFQASRTQIAADLSRAVQMGMRGR